MSVLYCVIIINRQMLVLIHNGHKLDIRHIIHDTMDILLIFT
jgi:hypothetical protein